MKNPTSDLVGFFALGFVNGSPHQTLAERVGGEAAIATRENAQAGQTVYRSFRQLIGSCFHSSLA